jgi:putative ubiquitin-RnfH superfamily antitoxin RatB of RatAB toxin-antitoxin module
VTFFCVGHSYVLSKSFYSVQVGVVIQHAILVSGLLQVKLHLAHNALAVFARFDMLFEPFQIGSAFIALLVFYDSGTLIHLLFLL